MTFKTKDLTIIAMCTALIAICSWISIPTAVPFTLQTFAVFLTILLIGGKRGTISVFIYIILGAIGVPVFANFTGGIGILLGNTGGYIIGFLVSALIMWAIMHLFGEKPLIQIISMVVGLFVCYTFGTAWFMILYLKSTGAVSLITVLSWCVIPYIIPDIIKILLAFVLASRLKKHNKLI